MTAINGIRRIFRLTFATDNMIVNNLLQIKSILFAKLQKEISEDKK